MFSFLKRSASAEEIADGVSISIKKWAEQGRSARYWPEKPLFREEFINDEWVYFDVFIFDFSTFLAFGNTAIRQKVLNHFERNIENWLMHRVAPRFHEARSCLFAYDKEPFFFPPEDPEPMINRLKRRLSKYAEAVAVQHPMGENYVVASVFSTLCGANDISYIAGISAYFSSMKIQQAKQLQAFRIR